MCEWQHYSFHGYVLDAASDYLIVVSRNDEHISMSTTMVTALYVIGSFNVFSFRVALTAQSISLGFHFILRVPIASTIKLID